MKNMKLNSYLLCILAIAGSVMTSCDSNAEDVIKDNDNNPAEETVKKSYVADCRITRRRKYQR